MYYFISKLNIAFAPDHMWNNPFMPVSTKTPPLVWLELVMEFFKLEC